MTAILMFICIISYRNRQTWTSTIYDIYIYIYTSEHLYYIHQMGHTHPTLVHIFWSSTVVCGSRLNCHMYAKIFKKKTLTYTHVMEYQTYSIFGLTKSKGSYIFYTIYMNGMSIVIWWYVQSSVIEISLGGHIANQIHCHCSLSFGTSSWEIPI